MLLILPEVLMVISFLRFLVNLFIYFVAWFMCYRAVHVFMCMHNQVLILPL